MIDLRLKNQDELETFVRKIKKGGYQKGVKVLYHVGNMGDTVGSSTILGKLMSHLAGIREVDGLLKVVESEAKVNLVQVKVSDNPRVYEYMGQVR